MLSSLSHTIFTLENYLAVKGQVYLIGNLAQSIDGLRVQEQASNTLNEDLNESVYKTLAKILREYNSIIDRIEKAQLLTSCNLFPNAPKTTSTSYDSLSKNKLKSLFKERELDYGFEPEKDVWIKLLKSLRHVTVLMGVDPNVFVERMLYRIVSRVFHVTIFVCAYW